MKSQIALRFALIVFSVSFAALPHAASVIQFTATSSTVAENAGQAVFLGGIAAAEAKEKTEIKRP